MTRRRRRILCGAALLLTGCSTAGSPLTAPARPAAVLVGSLTSDGVAVEVRWTPAGEHGGALAATFTPQSPGFHVYSATLPATGVGGVGRPTTLEVGGSLAAQGVPVADRSTVLLQVAGGAPVPVYPDGPVTLTVPVRLVRAGDAVAWVGFAACSATTCLLPVNRAPVRLALPAAVAPGDP